MERRGRITPQKMMTGDLSHQFTLAQEKRDNGAFTQAVKEYSRIREDAIMQNNMFLAAQCLHMIGVSYFQQESYEMAKDFFGRAIEALQQLQKEDWIAIVKRDLALVSAKEKDYVSADTLLQESITALQKTPLKGQLGMSQVKQGVILALQGKPEGAVMVIENGIATLHLSASDQFFLSTAYFDLAKVYKQAGKDAEAKQAGEKSLLILNSFASSQQFLLRRGKLDDFFHTLTN